MLTHFLCPLFHCEINCHMTLMRNWADAGSVLLDPLNCELNKLPFFTRYPATTVCYSNTNDLRQMWTLGDLYLVICGIWLNPGLLWLRSALLYPIALSKPKHPICMMGHLATEGTECQEKAIRDHCGMVWRTQEQECCVGRLVCDSEAT